MVTFKQIGVFLTMYFFNSELFITIERIFRTFNLMEIIERTKREETEYYQPKIDQLSSQNDSLSAQNDNLSAQVDYLKSLLTQHNIPFNLES